MEGGETMTLPKSRALWDVLLVVAGGLYLILRAFGSGGLRDGTRETPRGTYTGADIRPEPASSWARDGVCGVGSVSSVS